MNRDLEIVLIKVLYVFAWADGQLHEKEVSLIENLMLQISGLSTLDKVQLRLFGEYPIEQEERAQLIDSLISHLLKEPRYRDLAMNRIRALNQVDGIVSRAEKNILADIEKQTTFQAKVRKLVRNKFTFPKIPFVVTNRERELDELLNIPEVTEFFREMVQKDPTLIGLLEIQRTFYAAGMIGHFASPQSIEQQTPIFHMLTVYSTFRGPEQTLIMGMLEQKRVGLPELEHAALQIASSFELKEKLQFFNGLAKLAVMNSDGRGLRREKLVSLSRYFLLTDEQVEEALTGL